MEIAQVLEQHDVRSARRYFRAHGRPDLSGLPGDRGLPVLGHSAAVLRDVHAFLDKQYARYGSVFSLHGPRADGVFLLGPQANELLLKNEDRLFSNFLAWDLTFANIFDNNVLERDFGGHKRHRKILQSAFRRPSIEGHIEIMDPLIRQGLGRLRAGHRQKMLPFIKRLLLDVGANVFLGENVEQEADKLNKAFVDCVAATADPFKLNIPFTPFVRGVKGQKVLQDYIFRNIERKRAAPGRDLFSELCQLTDEDDGSHFSDQEISDHIAFLLFAAHDTTTSALCSVLFAMAANPEWQERLIAEVDAIGVDTLTHDEIDRMSDTSLVIQEALRMHPPLVMMPRYSLREFEFQGQRIPANTPCVISSLFTHYMEEYWSEPRRFDPQRFAPGRAEDKQHFFQYIPFGGGAHKCLGLHFAQVQGKIFLYHFFRRYRVEKRARQRFKYNNIPLTFPTNGLPLRVVPR
ncbi:MAG: cytochrome P450 [Halioglobus sp.]|nr:cytochrome P450 [Halioglobus sp.]|tara:strand:+ start:275 stop:1660 length:1386 start_codon:yes stop_codon:yes gene_type:complete